MFITLIVIVGLSFLILAHEAGHFFVAKLFRLKVDEFGFGFPPRIFAIRRGDTEYSVNWLPFGGFVKIAGENEAAPFVEETVIASDQRARGNLGKIASSPEAPRNDETRLFSFQPAWKRAAITAAGVVVNFIAGWLLLSFMFMIGTQAGIVVTDVRAGSPAALAGIVPGDVILHFTDAHAFTAFTNENRGKSITFEVRRGDEKLTLQATPRVDAPEGQGALGVAIVETGFERQGFFAALRDGFIQAGLVCWFTLIALYELIRELFVSHTLLPGVVGPIGIFGVARESARVGLIYLVNLLAIISLNLTIMNLIPFPALDGGRLFMIAIEKIKGSPISRKAERFANTIGFALLIALMVALSVRDIGNILKVLP